MSKKKEKGEETVYFVRCFLESQPGFLWKEGALQSSADSAKMLSFIKDADREHMALLCLSTKNIPLAYSVTALGAGNKAVVQPGELLRIPLLAGAQTIIMGHNHPSGTVTPSENDELLTKKIAEAAKLLGLKFLDHVIVGPGSEHYSFADAGKMPS